MANSATGLHKYKHAIFYYKQALELTQRTFGQYHDSLMSAFAGLARVQRLAGETRDAADTLLRQREVLKRMTQVKAHKDRVQTQLVECTLAAVSVLREIGAMDEAFLLVNKGTQGTPRERLYNMSQRSGRIWKSHADPTTSVCSRHTIYLRKFVSRLSCCSNLMSFRSFEKQTRTSQQNPNKTQRRTREFSEQSGIIA